MAWRYDPNARRYRNTEDGRFLSRERARELVDASLHAGGVVTDQLASLVASGMLSPDDWRRRMRQEIKDEYIRQAILGQGGRAQMTVEAWGSVGGTISEQYRHLDRKLNNFYDQVAAGELSEGEIARRSRMYINSAREAYERGLRRRLRGSSYDQVKWNVTSGESCPDCVDYANRGWMPIEELPTYPGSGATACKTNCACYLEYRASSSGEIFERDRIAIEDIVGSRYERPVYAA